MPAGIKPTARMSMAVAASLVAMFAQGQNIGKVSGGAITGSSAPRIGASQNLRAGSNLRQPGGESTGVSGYGYSEDRAATVSGKVAGYGTRASRKPMSEAVGVSGSSIGPGSTAKNDFVASMPKPVLAPMLNSAPAAVTDFGLTAPTALKNASHHAATRPKRKLNPDAVRDPFTHQIGMPGAPGLPGSAKPLVGLGSTQP